MGRRRSSRASRAVAALLGAFVGCVLLADLGSWSDNTVPGAIAGAFLGGILGHGLEAGTIRGRTGWVAFWAIAFILAGAAVDDRAGMMALPGAAFGLVFDWLMRDPPRASSS